MGTSSDAIREQKAIQPPGEIDPTAQARLASWLSTRVADFSGPLDVKRLSGGQSNPTFELVTSNRRYVLRRKPPGEVLSSAHAVDREFRVMQGLGSVGFPVPRVFGLCEDDSVIGSMFYVMELVDGRIIWDLKLTDFSIDTRRAIYHTQIDTLARLHKIDPAAAGLADFGKPGNYFGRQISRWTKQYRASSAPSNSHMERLIAWLPEMLPPDAPARVVHGDYRLDNMVLDPQRPEVKAVLDWELSTLGDPIADLTYFLLPWVLPATERNSLRGVDFAVHGIPTLEAAAERYIAKTGVTLARPLEWYLSYNLFRFAAILQGIAGRVLSGQANNERAVLAQGRVGPIADVAWSFARAAGAQA